MHGEQCGLGAIMMARLHGLKWKRVKETLERVGAPTTAEELGVESDHIIKALTLACTIRPERYTILNERKLGYEAAEKLARATGVIE
jgi:glycerol-1-phosphate dehydrogenase [NAD(P)+]